MPGGVEGWVEGRWVCGRCSCRLPGFLIGFFFARFAGTLPVGSRVPRGLATGGVPAHHLVFPFPCPHSLVPGGRTGE